MKSLITPIEAIEIMQYTPCEELHIVTDIVKEYGTNSEYYVEGKTYSMFLYALLYTAGRIQGIREERAKMRGGVR